MLTVAAAGLALTWLLLALAGGEAGHALRGRVIDAETGRSVSNKAKGFAQEVDACIQSRMDGWRFPIPKDSDGEATDASFQIALQLVPD